MFDIQTEKAPAAIKVLRKFAAVLLIAFVGYYGYGTYTEAKPAMDGYMAKANAVYSNQTLNIEGLPAIEIVGTLKQRDVDNFIEKNIKTQPEFLLNLGNLNSIKIYDAKNYISKFGEDGGLANFNGDLNLQIVNEKSTVSHELSHTFDDSGEFSNQEYSNYSFTEEFLKLYNAKPNSITDYGSTNSPEFFAEAGEMYINNPERLKSKNVEVYNYFDNLYGQYMK